MQPTQQPRVCATFSTILQTALSPLNQQIFQQHSPRRLLRKHAIRGGHLGAIVRQTQRRAVSEARKVQAVKLTHAVRGGYSPRQPSAKLITVHHATHSPIKSAVKHRSSYTSPSSNVQQVAGMTFKENLIDMQSYIHALDKDARIIMSANSKAMFEVLCLLSLDDPPSDPDQRLAYEQLVHTKVNRILKSQRQRCSRRERRRQARAQPASQSQNQSKSNQVKSQIHI